jgi:hypothetical protein
MVYNGMNDFVNNEEEYEFTREFPKDKKPGK